jgi:hypothetical protein
MWSYAIKLWGAAKIIMFLFVNRLKPVESNKIIKKIQL